MWWTPWVWSFLIACAACSGAAIFSDEARTGNHGLELAEGALARQVLHPAVRGDDEPVGRHDGERSPDARCDRLRACLEVRLVDLYDVRPRGLQVAKLLVHGLGVREGEARLVRVVVVLGLL